MEKYESRQQQTPRLRLENFWFYHKWKVLTVFLIICAFAVAIHSCLKKESVDLYVLYMVSGAYSNDQMDQLCEKLEIYIDDIDGDGEKRVQVITISFSEVLGRTDQTQESALARLVSHVASGPALFYVFDDANYEALKNTETDVFSDIGELSSSGFLSQDRFDATSAGFFDDLTAYEKTSQHFYFGMRTTRGIEEKDTRFLQIAQCRNTLKRIAEDLER